MALALACLLVVLSVASLFVGVIDLSWAALWSDPAALELLVVSRAPRTIAVVISGGALAVSGAIMQMLVRNRFVEPMTAGTGQGAALGILLVTLFAPGASIFVKMVLASLTALAAGAGFLAIVQRLPPTQPLLVALVGLIYGGILGAAVTFIAYQADLLQYVEIWMNGEFSGVLQGRYELLWLVALVAALTYLAADQFAIIGMGRTASINLGLNYGQTMVLGLLAISIVTALTVVTVGLIPFVGLVVPNIVARLAGDNLRRSLPLTAMTGAGLVLLCDILGRLIRYPYEIPVGTVFGVVGALLFLWLLHGPKRHVS
ncbi:iron chelate uptake ABC transporter family permease subunit [Sulfitobacter sp. KE34]|uniref:Iron chelate uptake ABC transporter family permease subunit n=1 Tax=Sulfitobacter faviae TaxID=1775881 RepID=A0AAX3LRB7_9RHOB|nr:MULTISPECIES: iron chelate uptake ABC transporter family permease subunit [Sulfitobacter]MBO9429801.1 iron chelate uptake ABC transporter family permease subunit [Sulfitobacter sp. R18_1]MDF3351474.1 iron chelate uptake ABC transporter family permease subunit [Sulfitobacter sp. KE12]MDF3355146.1 iron chelate uptake ABC transporter family permease subunit [Sulfitobacter sp. KE27]MDF3358794.1 iron chelate uptake ABC transporter family permease subunit [Sulfitobacter sp. KE33]MDF3362471.1 iron